MRYCPRCGSEVNDGDSFCKRCGQSLKASEQPVQRPMPIPHQRDVKIRWAAVIAMTVMLVMASVGGIYILTKDITVEDKDITVSYTWRADEKSYSYSLTIPIDQYHTMKKSQIDKDGTVSSDFYKRTVDGEVQTVYGVKDYIVVDKVIVSLVSDLKALYDEKYDGMLIKPEFAQFLAWFVQNAIDYELDSSDGTGEYWKYPLETLRDGRGDCEDTSILLAAMLTAAGYKAGIFLLPGHAMAAVSTDSVSIPFFNARFGYYPIETAVRAHTDVYSIGYISLTYQHAYFHLYTGSVKEYA